MFSLDAGDVGDNNNDNGTEEDKCGVFGIMVGKDKEVDDDEAEEEGVEGVSVVAADESTAPLVSSLLPSPRRGLCVMEC